MMLTLRSIRWANCGMAKHHGSLVTQQNFQHGAYIFRTRKGAKHMRIARKLLSFSLWLKFWLNLYGLFHISTASWASTRECGWNIQHGVQSHWRGEGVRFVNFWIFHNIKVSTELNYFRGKEHVVTYCLPKNFNDRFSSSDSRDKNVCTLDRPKTTDVWLNFRFTNQNIEVVWRIK
jgi:hypothetical protein